MKDKLQKISNLIQEGSHTAALLAPKFWINTPPAPSYFVTDFETYNSALESLFITEKKWASRFSRKTFFAYVEGKILKLRTSNLPVDDTFTSTFFKDLEQTIPAAVTVVAPISGIFLSSHTEFEIGCFRFFSSKKLMMPIAGEHECLCIAVRVNEIYDVDIARQKAKSCFSDFCRIVHFLIGTFDKKNVIKVGLPLLPHHGPSCVYAETSSFAFLDDQERMMSSSISNKTFNAIPIDDTFFCAHETLKKVWELYDSMYQEKRLTKMQQRLINAVLAIGESAKSHDLRNSVIYSCVALETLFSFDEGSLFKPGIGEQIAEALAFVIATDAESRLETYKFAKKIYAFRSALVHGGNKKISSEYIILNQYIRMAIASILNDSRWENTFTIDKFYEQIKEARFA